MDRLRIIGLLTGLSLQVKSEFFRASVEYCGVRVSSGKIQVLQDKVESVQNWPIPKSVRDIRSFLGLAGYYRRFIHKFSAIAKPLTNLTKKSVDFNFDDTALTAFTTLKAALTSSPVLYLPDQSKPFVVVPDASGYAIGGVLLQDGLDGTGLHPVSFLSRQMTDAELKYTTHQQELLALALVS